MVVDHPLYFEYFHRTLVCIGFASGVSPLSLASRAQRNPIQFILVTGSVPLRCAPRTLGVLSIQPPPRKLRCVPFSSPLIVLSNTVTCTSENEAGLTHRGKSYGRAMFTFPWQVAEKSRQPVLFIWSVWSIWSLWLIWLVWFNQISETDRACPRRVSHRSTAFRIGFPTVSQIGYDRTSTPAPE